MKSNYDFVLTGQKRYLKAIICQCPAPVASVREMTQVNAFLSVGSWVYKLIPEYRGKSSLMQTRPKCHMIDSASYQCRRNQKFSSD